MSPTPSTAAEGKVSTSGPRGSRRENWRESKGMKPVRSPYLALRFPINNHVLTESRRFSVSARNVSRNERQRKVYRKAQSWSTRSKKINPPSWPLPSSFVSFFSFYMLDHCMNLIPPLASTEEYFIFLYPFLSWFFPPFDCSLKGFLRKDPSFFFSFVLYDGIRVHGKPLPQEYDIQIRPAKASG